MKGIPENKLNSKIISVWTISAIIAAIVIGVILFIISAVLDHLLDTGRILYMISVGVAAIYGIIFGLITPKIRYRRWAYSISEREVHIYKGILFRTWIIIPLVRVQYTDTTQGPLMRSKDLSEVTVTTAGGTESIPGLISKDADELRNRIALLAHSARE